MGTIQERTHTVVEDHYASVDWTDHGLRHGNTLILRGILSGDVSRGLSQGCTAQAADNPTFRTHYSAASCQIGQLTFIKGGRIREESGITHPGAHSVCSLAIGTRQGESCRLRFSGPSWLHHDSLSWPTHVLEKDLNVDLEGQPGDVLHVHVQPLALWDLIDRYSSLNRLLRVTAICRRFIARLRRVPNFSLHHPLTLGDLEEARIIWIKLTEAAHLKDQLRTISPGERFTKSHSLNKLTSFIHHQGVLRVGGRLQFVHINPESRNLAILPKESQLAQLLIGQAHLQTLHGGTQLTLSQLKRSYWILGGRAPVRSFILRCIKCARQRRARAQQLMGQLPPARLTPARAFLNTGVDYAGPVSLRSWKGRGHTSYKGWVAIFVCMTTSAVHLEVVSDYSAEGFIAAYGRFTSRRGICAPHFGGKSEVAVKSGKFHLNRTIGEDLLTFEELTIFLAQIEAVLNWRPLQPLIDDPEDCSALTPGLFQILDESWGQAPTTHPEP
ncbi:uncharacterized protein LOC107042845 [Diachasma alloeum]|uniref:uncharacterized protein LOC107042845 n=1 Tax=Diachasma alloeum TaxID=454923 RepID=UPI00073849DB|nr:uncharacterized protein LOC107042845 [Diachasma alloeum]